jgi:hypothetical protein
MGTYIRHNRSPEAPPRRPDHPTFGDEAARGVARHLAALRERWSQLRSKAAPILERLVRKAPN